MKKYLGHKRRFIPHKKSSVTYDKSLFLTNIVIESSIKSRPCRNKILSILTTQAMWKEYSQAQNSCLISHSKVLLGIMREHCWRYQTCDDDIGSSVLKESGIKKKVMLLQDIRRNSSILHLMFSANVESVYISRKIPFVQLCYNMRHNNLLYGY